MQILLNGEPYSVPANCNVATLLQQLALVNKRLAVEINTEIVPRSQFAQHILAENDKVEIVQAIGGG